MNNGNAARRSYDKSGSPSRLVSAIPLRIEGVGLGVGWERVVRYFQVLLSQKPTWSGKNFVLRNEA